MSPSRGRCPTRSPPWSTRAARCAPAPRRGGRRCRRARRRRPCRDVAPVSDRGSRGAGSCRSAHPGAVVEEPGVRLSRHALDERLGVGAPLVVEQGEDRDGHLLDLFELRRRAWRAQALVEGDVLHPVGPGLAVDDLGKKYGSRHSVYMSTRRGTVEVVESDVLGLALLGSRPCATCRRPASRSPRRRAAGAA